MSVLCVLPARLESERIPRKPLQLLAGRPLIEWSWRAARTVPTFDEVWVATDSQEIAERVRAFGGSVILTDPGLPSGTDRVATAVGLIAARKESAGRPAQKYDIVVNFQADEPFADPGSIGRAVRSVQVGEAPIATLAAALRSEEEWRSEAVVKVAMASDGRALYFSRAPIPYPRGRGPEFSKGPDPDVTSRFLRHVGIYVFAREALERWVRLPPSALERIEGLEQLRALEADMPIRVVSGPITEAGVDEPADLARVERTLAERGITAGSQPDG